jgi:hypothetical protein
MQRHRVGLALQPCRAAASAALGGVGGASAASSLGGIGSSAGRGGIGTRKSAKKAALAKQSGEHRRRKRGISGGSWRHRISWRQRRREMALSAAYHVINGIWRKRCMAKARA